MASLSEVLKIARASRNQFNHWLDVAKVLRTRYAKTAPGVARDLTLKNAIEISFMSALARAGLDAADAAAETGHLIKKWKIGILSPLMVINPTTKARYEFSTTDLSLHQLRHPIPDATSIEESGGGWVGDEQSHPASELHVIDFRAILKRLSPLFPGDQFVVQTFDSDAKSGGRIG